LDKRTNTKPTGTKIGHLVTQQEDSDINLPINHSNQTDRQTASQQSQNIMAVNQAKVPKPRHLKKAPRTMAELIKKARPKPWKMKEVCNLT